MKSMISWFAKNGVAANLLMAFVLFAGFYTLKQRIILEVFPEFEHDIINISVPYRGATPAEVEEGVVVRIEEAIQDLVGIEEITSTAVEGVGTVRVEVDSSYEPRELLDDVKNRVDAISTFPDDIEKPTFNIVQRRREVISVVVSGNVSERELRETGRQIQDEILNLPRVTQAFLTEIRPYEISIEIAENTLRKYGLTFDAVATAIDNSSLDLPAGAIKSRGGEILLRTKGQAYIQNDFESIVVLKKEDGTRLTLGDIAVVKDDFEEESLAARFNGKPCVVIDVYRVGDQNAIHLAQEVKDYLLEAQRLVPPGIELNYWRDRSRIVKARLNTLTRSAMQGGLLVFLLLAMFLRFQVALWVCIGIPVSFMGAIALMPTLGVTVNIVSLFAFILVLGVVVDDAIVTGENIYSHLGKVKNATEAAIKGAQEVAVPVTFGILTTVAAFLPLAMVEGIRGKIFAQIPMVVIPVLLFSLMESKLVLPSHLKHVKVYGEKVSPNKFSRLQQKIANWLLYCIETYYKPTLVKALERRYLTLSLFIGITLIFFSIVMSGHIRFVFFPRVQSETARGTLSMPTGTPFEVTASYVKKMNSAAERLRKKYIDPDTGKSVIKDILATEGSAGSTSGKSHLGRVMFEIVSPEDRTIDIKSSELVREWRKDIGPLPGAKELSFRAEIGRVSDPINIQLRGQLFEELTEVADQIKMKLAEYPGVFDITDSFQEGKEEVKLSIKPEAEHLGLSLADLARQTRDAFFGKEVQRIQRGRDDVRVMIRYPIEERRSLGNLENMMIRTPEGIEVPFSHVADAHLGKSYATIKRVDRHRIINVSADLNKEAANIGAIIKEITAYIGDLLVNSPNISYTMEGEAREQRETFGSLYYGMGFVLFAIYALLAIPFRSYIQPLIVMSVIPFGLVGAIIGHIIMGMNMSIFSVFGMLALTGVVVNDSLVLVDYVNRRRSEGLSTIAAISQAGVVRFRPILLTSLTTFAGLIPLISEKSTQAQFLIPMAVSLGFGVLFATFVTLLLVPINYLILEDLQSLYKKP